MIKKSSRKKLEKIGENWKKLEKIEKKGKNWETLTSRP